LIFHPTIETVLEALDDDGLGAALVTLAVPVAFAQQATF
jgi:hypothetical protein